MVAAYLRAPPAVAVPYYHGCTGKVRMKKVEADAVVKGTAMMAYKCGHCFCWHVSKWTKAQVRYAKSLPSWQPPA